MIAFLKKNLTISIVVWLNLFAFLPLVAQQVTQHTVQKGETLYRISHTYGVTIDQLTAANPGLTPETLKAGATIRIPSGSKLQATEHTTEPTASNGNLTDSCRVMHKVKRKETLWGIALQYGVSPEDLQRANPGIPADGSLKKGNYLCIPYPRKEETPTIVTPVGYEELKVAVLLPLTADGLVGDRSLDFYRGFLMAADLLKKEGKKITIYAYDEPAANVAPTALLQAIKNNGVQLVVGPLYLEHIDEVANFARQNEVKVLIPFSSKTQQVNSNDQLFLLNAREAKKHEFAANLFLNYFPKKTKVVFVGDATKGNERVFTEYLRQRLVRENIPVALLPDNFTPSQLAAQSISGHTLVLVYHSSTTATRDLATRSVSAFRKNYPEANVALFGYPEWQIESGPHRQILHDANAYLFTNTFYNPWSEATRRVVDDYERWFQQEMPEETPRMALLGYDSGTVMLRGLSVYGKKFTTQDMQLPLLQSDISFSRVGDNGGYVNSSLWFIHYRPDGTLEKVAGK